MLAKPSVAVVPADRRASAFRRFPPGCGRRHRNAAPTRIPHADPLPITSSSAAAATATKPPLPNPSVARAAATATKPPLPNPSVARAAHKAAPPRSRRATPAAASSGTEGPGRGVGSGRKAAAAVSVRRPVSAVRRYPPGCGRGVAVSKRPAPVGEDGAGEPTEMVGKGKGEPKARACDREEMLRASAFDREGFDPNGEVLKKGDGVVMLMRRKKVVRSLGW